MIFIIKMHEKILSEMFSYIDFYLDFKINTNKESNHSYLIKNDRNSISNLIKFNLWNNFENIDKIYYKSYIKRAVINTINNHLRNEVSRLKRENNIPFLTLEKQDDGSNSVYWEIIPDIIDPIQKKDLHLDEFSSTLISIKDKEFLNDLRLGFDCQDYIKKYNLTKRQFHKRKLNLKYKYREFIKIIQSKDERTESN